MPAATRTWAVPPRACDGGTWDDAAASVRLSYLGLPPAYVPRPNQETAARAFELSTQGRLTRLYDLVGDTAARAAARPADAPVDALLAAPRADDSRECARATGGYTADRVCVEAADVAFTSPVVHGHQNSFYSWWRANALLHSEEHKRLAREEWRDELRVYAAPFYNELRMRGQINAPRPASTSAYAPSASVSAAGEISAAGDADEAYEAWFVTWV